MKADQTGADFELSIEGMPRTYRDTKAVADEAAAILKQRYPNSDVMERETGSGLVLPSPAPLA
jgi:hypothetical protein